MAFHSLFRPKGRTTSTKRRRRKTDAGSALLRFLETNRLVAWAVFVLTVASIFTISFVGITPTAYQFHEGQTATVRIVAERSFSYQSAILTARRRARVEREVPPVFRIDMKVLEDFEAQFRLLLSELSLLDARWPKLSEAERLGELSTIADAFSQRTQYAISARDLMTVMTSVDATTREQLFENGLFVLREIHRRGIADSDSPLTPKDDSGSITLQVVKQTDGIEMRRGSTDVDALQNLRANIVGQNISPALSSAVFRLLQPGVSPNLRFDERATNALRADVLAKLKPEMRSVEAGQSIIEPRTRVTAEQEEMLRAYQDFLNQPDETGIGWLGDIDISSILLVMGMIIVAGIYIRIEDPMTLQSNGRLALLALVFICSLGGVRGVLELGANLPGDQPLGAFLPYLAPTAFAPMIIAVLIGVGPALFMGLLVSVFSAIIFGNRLDFLVISLLTTSVAAFACRAVRRRGQLVKAGWLSGLTLAASVLGLGLAEGFDPWYAAGATGVAQSIGIVTGIVVIGLLPIMESLFKRTTDITLLELTDYNHPLLRRMQMDAPGTYHHSLMVGNLSENAASAIGANALLCRVCSMFHDIGKLVKPDYFTENQREGINPHNERSPSLSALIIKSHVKEGIDLAVKHKLPRPILDVIRQHHGTTLIRYFYESARRRAREANEAAQAQSGTAAVEATSTDESNFRYDGPKPQFKESAIILVADSIEAASRSLQKVTPQAVEDLIDAIIREKIDDGQIDEAPLTIEELATIRKSFTHTLLNALHSRVVYPKSEKPEKAGPSQGRRQPGTGIPTGDTPTKPVTSASLGS